MINIKKVIKSKVLYIILFAILIRVAYYNIIGPDYLNFLKDWYNDIIQNGGISSLKVQIGNYSDAYMFILTIGTYITKNSLLWVKLISVIFDFIIMIFTYRIYKHFALKESLLKSCLILFIPGVIINSAVLGQCDAIYMAFVLMFVYYILKNKPNISLIFLGVAVCFKIQAIFIAPIMLYLLFTKRVRIRNLPFLLIGFIIPLIPSIICGKGLIENIKILLMQTSQYNSFVKSAPNIYSLLFLNYVDLNIYLKYALSAIVVGITVFIVLKGNHKNFEQQDFMKKILKLSLLVPFFLPSMHDRYFYMAGIFIVLYYTIFENKYTMKMILASFIAYLLPVISINFLITQNYIYVDYIMVSVISTIINLYIVYRVIVIGKINNNIKSIK